MSELTNVPASPFHPYRTSIAQRFSMTVVSSGLTPLDDTLRDLHAVAHSINKCIVYVSSEGRRCFWIYILKV